MRLPDFKKLPRKWNPLMLLVGVAGLTILGIYCYVAQKTETPATVSVPTTRKMNDNIGGVGGAGSPEFNAMMREDNQQRAEQASEGGKSFMPAPVGKPGSLLLEQPRKESAPNSTPSVPSGVASSSATTQQTTRGKDYSKEAARLATYMDNLRQAAKMDGSPVSYTFKLPAPEKLESAPPSATAQTFPGMEQLVAGTILYASNELTVNSDVAGAPVLATVVHGPLKGAKALGKFTLSGEQLVVQFQTLSKDGVTVAFNGFAVDPDKATAGVASHVNNHTLTRWGSFIAAVFLQGLGEALAESGSTRVYNSYESVTLKDKYKPSEQAQIAAGKVGERAATHLEKNLDRPPTVTLYAGTPLGVLVVK